MKKSMVILGMSVAFGISGAFAGAKLEIEKDVSFVDVGCLGQFHYIDLEDAANGSDFYIRRARIILNGQILDGVKFFVDTDNANAGKDGMSVSTEIQDAFVDFRLLKTDMGEHWLKVGLILLPFSFENRSSAASLLGTDYNAEGLKLANTFTWRDNGAELHGNLGKKFAYVAGAFDGYDIKGGTKNPDSPLRYTGHVSYNILGEAETGFFFTQERLGKKGSYLAIGTGFDSQDEATLRIIAATNSTPESRSLIDNQAYVIDMQSGYKVTDRFMMTLNAGYFTWDNAVFEGDTVMAETGAMLDRNQVTLKYVVQNPDEKSDVEDFTVGYNFFLKGHNARVGAEYRWGDSPDQILGGVQILL